MHADQHSDYRSHHSDGNQCRPMTMRHGPSSVLFTAWQHILILIHDANIFSAAQYPDCLIFPSSTVFIAFCFYNSAPSIQSAVYSSATAYLDKPLRCQLPSAGRLPPPLQTHTARLAGIDQEPSQTLRIRTNGHLCRASLFLDY